jgi:hypothetical protein
LQRIESRKAPKIGVADSMRAFTSASEVRDKWMIEPRYLNSRTNITKPPSARAKREVSPKAVEVG